MPYPYSEADARFFLEVIVPAEQVWMVVERSSEQAAGVIGLAADAQEPAAVKLGYNVARERGGCGIATEAGSAVVA